MAGSAYSQRELRWLAVVLFKGSRLLISTFQKKMYQNNTSRSFYRLKKYERGFILVSDKTVTLMKQSELVKYTPNTGQVNLLALSVDFTCN